MYGETLLDHFRNPRNVGELPSPAVTVEVMNPACGDLMRLAGRFEDGRLTEVRYQTRGCTASIAVGSALTEWMLGKTLAELSGIDAGIVESAIGGLPNESRHAAVLCVDAVRALVAAAQPRK